MTRRKFTRLDGYEIRDLLNYANDHLKASKYLFSEDPACYDSAGYLAHMGLELLLKAWHLHEHGFFTDSHSLHSIYVGIKEKNQDVTLASAHLATLKLVDQFNALRYPSLRSPIEIGSEDWDRIMALLAALSRAFPKECVAEYHSIVKFRKGGRVLMKRSSARKGTGRAT